MRSSDAKKTEQPQPVQMYRPRNYWAEKQQKRQIHTFPPLSLADEILIHSVPAVPPLGELDDPAKARVIDAYMRRRKAYKCLP